MNNTEEMLKKLGQYGAKLSYNKDKKAVIVTLPVEEEDEGIQGNMLNIINRAIETSEYDISIKANSGRDEVQLIVYLF